MAPRGRGKGASSQSSKGKSIAKKGKKKEPSDYEFSDESDESSHSESPVDTRSTPVAKRRTVKPPVKFTPSDYTCSSPSKPFKKRKQFTVPEDELSQGELPKPGMLFHARKKNTSTGTTSSPRKESPVKNPSTSSKRNTRSASQSEPREASQEATEVTDESMFVKSPSPVRASKKDKVKPKERLKTPQYHFTIQQIANIFDWFIQQPCLYDISHPRYHEFTSDAMKLDGFFNKKAKEFPNCSGIFLLFFFFFSLFEV